MILALWTDSGYPDWSVSSLEAEPKFSKAEAQFIIHAIYISLVLSESFWVSCFHAVENPQVLLSGDIVKLYS